MTSGFSVLDQPLEIGPFVTSTGDLESNSGTPYLRIRPSKGLYRGVETLCLHLRLYVTVLHGVRPHLNM